MIFDLCYLIHIKRERIFKLFSKYPYLVKFKTKNFFSSYQNIFVLIDSSFLNIFLFIINFQVAIYL